MLKKNLLKCFYFVRGRGVIIYTPIQFEKVFLLTQHPQNGKSLSLKYCVRQCKHLQTDNPEWLALHLLLSTPCTPCSNPHWCQRVEVDCTALRCLLLHHPLSTTVSLLTTKWSKGKGRLFAKVGLGHSMDLLHSPPVDLQIRIDHCDYMHV